MWSVSYTTYPKEEETDFEKEPEFVAVIRNAELAELKEEMKAKQVVLNDFKSRIETVTDRFNKKSSQLTKAKEIIKDLLRLPYANDWEVYGDVTSHLDKAEQFLKETEKWHN